MCNQRNIKNPIPTTALITGASSGIGYRYAQQLAAKGYELIIVSNEEQQIFNIAKQLHEEYHVEIHPIAMNLATVDAARTLYDKCSYLKLQIDILISNAGIFFFNEIDKINDTRIEEMLILHTVTPTMLCKFFGADMKTRHHGHILLMSSLAAWSPYPGLEVYAATKRYLKEFGKALHYEMKDYNVGVTSICPGAINTSLLNLPDKLRKIALNLHVMMEPDKLAKKALRAMFRNKVYIVPGVLNKISIPILDIIPMPLINLIKKQSKILYR